MKHDSFKTYLHWGLTAFGVVALSILFFFSLFKVGALVHFFQTLLGILMPFVYGLAMAYLLTPVFNWLHARFAPALQKHVKNPRRAARAAKFLSTTLSVLLALLLVAALLWMVLPQVISSIVGLVESNLLTNSIQNVTGWIEDTLQNNPQFEAAAQRVYAEAVAALTAWVKTDMLPQLTNLMSGLLGTLTFSKEIAPDDEPYTVKSAWDEWPNNVIRGENDGDFNYGPAKTHVKGEEDDLYWAAITGVEVEDMDEMKYIGMNKAGQIILCYADDNVAKKDGDVCFAYIFERAE